MTYVRAALIVASLALAFPGHASDDRETASAVAARKLGPDWQAITTPVATSYMHASNAALNFQCNDGDPMYAYIQLPVEGTDIRSDPSSTEQHMRRSHTGTPNTSERRNRRSRTCPTIIEPYLRWRSDAVAPARHGVPLFNA